MLCAIVLLAVGSHRQTPEKDGKAVDGKAILNTFYEVMHDAPTATGVINSNLGAHPHRTVFKIMRPNLFSMDSEDFEVRGDGKNLFVHTRGRKDAMHFQQTSGAPDIYGFEPMTSDEKPSYVKAGELKAGLFRGAAAYVVPISDDRSKMGGAVNLYIDQKSLLPLGCEFSSKGKSSFLAYENVQLGTKMSRSDFIYKASP
jgi:hypothetical protein